MLVFQEGGKLEYPNKNPRSKTRTKNQVYFQGHFADVQARIALPLRDFWVNSYGLNQAFILLFTHCGLKGHSHLCDGADLDTSFSHFEKSLPQPEIKVHLEIRIIFRSVLLELQSFTEKPVFECPVAHPMTLF